MKEKNKKFVESELQNLRITIGIISEAVGKFEWSSIERAGVGAYLSDIYKGYENIFVSLLEERDIRIPKGERWHSELLERANAEKLVPDGLNVVMRGMLSYRHRAIHGYSHMLDERAIREGSDEVIKTFPVFEKHILQIFNTR